jgi:manganese efflux pump family protein
VFDAIVLAFALSLDSAAIAAACGAVGTERGAALRMAVVFALFHIAMATVGWMAGTVAEDWISTWDHWIAFGLLSAIGVKMVWTALRPGGPVDAPATWSTLIGLAVATSLDAVAAGVTLPLLASPPLVTIGLIGGVVFCVVLLGVRIGAVVGSRLGRVFDVIGGLAVIAIGVRILVEHTG